MDVNCECILHLIDSLAKKTIKLKFIIIFFLHLNTQHMDCALKSNLQLVKRLWIYIRYTVGRLAACKNKWKD